MLAAARQRRADAARAVRFDNFEHDQPTTATVFQHHPWRAKEGTTIDKLQTQIVIAGTIDFVRVQAIQAASNELVSSEARLKADLGFDIDCVVASADGSPVITRRWKSAARVRVHVRLDLGELESYRFLEPPQLTLPRPQARSTQT